MKRYFVILASIMLCFGANLHAQKWYFNGLNSDDALTRAATRMVFQAEILPDPEERAKFLEELEDNPSKFQVFEFFTDQMTGYALQEDYPISRKEYYKFIQSVISIPGMEKYYPDMFVSAALSGELYSFKILVSKIGDIDGDYLPVVDLPREGYVTVRENALVNANYVIGSAAKDSQYYARFNKIVSYLKGAITFGYQEILDNMRESALANIPLDKTIKDNPDIYSTENVLALLTAGAMATTSVVAEDYLSKAKAIQSISKVVPAKTIAVAEDGMTLRLYKLFMKRIQKNAAIVDKLDDPEDFNQAMADYNYDAAELALLDAVSATTLYFIFDSKHGNGKISTAEESAIIFGTQENEFKDGLLSLAARFDGFYGELGVPIKKNLVTLKVLLLCNNDMIITAKGNKEDVVEFFTQDYVITSGNNTQHSLALELYAFGSLDESSFKQGDFVMYDALNRPIPLFDAQKIDLNKGLEKFKNINSIINKGLEKFKNINSIIKK